MVDILDPMQEAILECAPHIGKDWITLYSKLPFTPSRDFKTRTKDIEGEKTVRRHYYNNLLTETWCHNLSISFKILNAYVTYLYWFYISKFR